MCSSDFHQLFFLEPDVSIEVLVSDGEFVGVLPEADAWEAWFISPAGAPEGCAEGQVSCVDEGFEPGEGCVDAGGVAEVFHLFYVGSAHVGQQEWIEGIMFGFPFVCVFHVEPAAHGEAFGRKAAVL